MSLISQIANFLTPSTHATTPIAPPTIPTAQTVNGNPFLNNNNTDNSIYGKNMPVPGGYFAGYHNGKPNIVGKKLFVII